MAKKQQPSQKNTPPAPKAAPVRAATPKPVPQSAAAEQSFIQKYAQWLMLAGIGIVTYFFYKGALDDQFTNWDDLGYVLTNPLIKDSSTEGLKRLFSLDSPVMGNYHPLTIVTYWYEYSKHGLEPYIYHFHSVLFHIITTFSVFAFVKVLTRSNVGAMVASLLFALHPMHVESVTWIAGRKDLLYGLFYMLACVTHIYYIRSEGNKKWMWFAGTIVLFALSLMCKSVGVTLPVVLLFVDYFEKRKLNIGLLLEKIPLFALSVTFGLISIDAQHKIGALGTLDVNFNWIETVALSCYAFCTYIWKVFLPIGLTNFYPYPLKDASAALPGSYYIFPVIVAGMLFVLVKYFRHNRLIMLGVSFFIINLLLLLQFLHVGGAIMSDRYTYIPYVGLFLILAGYIGKLYEEKKPFANVVVGVCLAACLAFGYMTNERNKDWYDSISLWNDAIAKDPQSPVGYFYLGQEYYTRFESATTLQDRQKYGDSAFHYFNESVMRKPDYTNPMICIGEYQRSVGKIDDAKATYLKALTIKKDEESAFLGLGVVYSIKQMYDSAAPNFRRALSLKAYFPEAYSNYANFLEITGKRDSALIMYEKALTQNPDAYIPYMNRATIYVKQNRFDLALKDYDHANMLKPEMPEPYFRRSECYAKLGKKAQALQEADEAKKRGYQVDPAYYQSLK